MANPLDAVIGNDLPTQQLALSTPDAAASRIASQVATTLINVGLTALGLDIAFDLFPDLETQLQRDLERNNGNDVTTSVRTAVQNCVVNDLGDIGNGSRKARELENLYNQNGDQLARSVAGLRPLAAIGITTQTIDEQALERWESSMESMTECLNELVQNGIRCTDGRRERRCRFPAIVERCVEFEGE